MDIRISPSFLFLSQSMTCGYHPHLSIIYVSLLPFSSKKMVFSDASWVLSTFTKWYELFIHCKSGQSFCENFFGQFFWFYKEILVKVYVKFSWKHCQQIFDKTLFSKNFCKSILSNLPQKTWSQNFVCTTFYLFLQ